MRGEVLEFCRICAETQPRHETYFIVPGLHCSDLTDFDCSPPGPVTLGCCAELNYR